MKPYRTNVMLCGGTGCVSNGAFKIKDALERELRKHNLQDEVGVVMTGCNGFCAQGPVAVVKPDEIFYQLLEEKSVARLVEEHFLKGRPVKELLYTPPAEKTPVPKMSDIGFFSKQMLIALRNRGMIDPEQIDEYIGRDGYKALAKALTAMTPEKVIKEVSDSGLRGRGGAGFPTGRKWESRRKDPRTPKYVVCNADEGDPGAFMDRSIVEADPHAVIEGMAIGAYAAGASKGYVYIRMEYPLAVKRMRLAIEQAREYGLLGEDIFDSGFDFDIDIFQGAGAFVCGETTALVASIEGKIPEPRQRPPRTTLWGKPVVINNVETWANVPAIINRGARWFSSIGTETSKGTKVFSLAGDINNAGLVEVPMGITLREIVYDIGGGIPKNNEFKAVQTGGPSGGVIPASRLDLPVDYEQLDAAGSMMGSGGMIIMSQESCMVDVARYFLEFLNDESCGKCTSCREGSREMHHILERICNGQGREGDIELLEELGTAVREASLCGLGQSLPNPVLSSLEHFREEYEDHINNSRCPAGVCKALITFNIDEEKCTGCRLCAKNCPEHAIAGEAKEPHTIDQDKCIKCGVCVDVCKFEAVLVT